MEDDCSLFVALMSLLPDDQQAKSQEEIKYTDDEINLSEGDIDFILSD